MEGGLKRIRIKDIPPDAFEFLLKLLTHKKPEVTDTIFLSVVRAAHRYDLNHVLTYCSGYVKELASRKTTEEGFYSLLPELCAAGLMGEVISWVPDVVKNPNVANR